MNILHALFGYLAVLTTLASHLFAFASPLRLAADYDGYVKTSRNHIDCALVLGSNVETCQAVTTQNYKNSALMKRVSGDIIEARQAELAIPLGFIVVDIVAGITLKLVLFNKDDSVRG